MKDFVVHKQIEISAPLSEVWDALTNPEKTKKYFFHCEVLSDWKEGSAITFKGKIFFIKKIELSGKILRIKPEALLEYTLKNSDDEDETNFSTVTDELSYANGVTTLSISDDVGSGEGAQDRYDRSENGWDKVLQGLKDLVEKNDW